MRWRNIIAWLIAPLGAPVSFHVWDRLAMEPRSFIDILSLPGLLRFATPIAYAAALLLGLPAVLILSRKKFLTLPVVLIAGTLIGTITGLLIGFHVAGYDMSAMDDYIAFDLMSIYAPAAISGMVSSAIYWGIRKKETSAEAG